MEVPQLRIVDVYALGGYSSSRPELAALFWASQCGTDMETFDELVRNAKASGVQWSSGLNWIAGAAKDRVVTWFLGEGGNSTFTLRDSLTISPASCLSSSSEDHPSRPPPCSLNPDFPDRLEAMAEATADALPSVSLGPRQSCPRSRAESCTCLPWSPYPAPFTATVISNRPTPLQCRPATPVDLGRGISFEPRLLFATVPRRACCPAPCSRSCPPDSRSTFFALRGQQSSLARA